MFNIDNRDQGSGLALVVVHILIFLVFLVIANSFCVVHFQTSKVARGISFGFVVCQSLLLCPNSLLLHKDLRLDHLVHPAATTRGVFYLEQREAVHIKLGQKLIVMRLIDRTSLCKGPMKSLLEHERVSLGIPH